jgi:dTDP-4-amino-4,6-dideoxygalactose transaminase
MVTRAIPKNATGLTASDYLSYFKGMGASGGADERIVEPIWTSLLPGRTLVATPTGRHALWRFLQIADLKKGDEVLVAGYNFYVIVRLLVQWGMVPVFVDVEPETLCMDAGALEARIGPRSRMVLVTHMFGNPAGTERIGGICRRQGLLLFEDCAHAVGTRRGGVQIGGDGDGALFSFGVEKLINSFGGGLLSLRPGTIEQARPEPPPRVGWTTSVFDHFTRFAYSAAVSPGMYRWVVRPASRALKSVSPSTERAIHDYFHPSKDDPSYRFTVESRPPFKPFMADMQARQLERLDANVSRRRALVQRMREGLARIPEVRLLDMDRHGQANASYFTIVVPDPYVLTEYLGRHAISAHPQEFLDCSMLAQFTDYRADCPAARYASGHVLRLPSYPGLADADADRIVDAVASYFRGNRGSPC